MKTNLTKLIVGILIAGALLIAGAGLGYLSTNYEFVSKEDIKEETNINTIEEEKEEEELQAEPAELNVDLAPNTSNDILSEGVSISVANNYSHVVVEATDFRF